MNIKDYMTIHEAAEFVGVSENTLRNWEASGKIKPMRNPINNYRYYKKEDLEKLFSEIKIQDDK